MSSTTNYKPRLCNIVRGPNGYGFHLHNEKGKAGHYIRKVESGSPADHAGLNVGDKIIEVNGRNVEKESHHEVVARIKEKSNETNLLVVDKDAEDYFKEKNITISAELLHTEPNTEDQSENVKIESKEELRPRLCHLVRDESSFGFNLHSEKGKQGSYIRSVEKNGPSYSAGLRAGDRIIEINGKNMEYEKHDTLVKAIKESGNEVDMLVVDEKADDFFKSLNVTATIEHVTGPLPTRQETDGLTNHTVESASENNLDSTSATDDKSKAQTNAAQTNGTDLPNMNLEALKQAQSRSSRKKGPPKSNWNNRQAMFNNL